MKLWKKTLAMLMCCGFVFSTAACTDDNSGSGSGDGGNEEQVLEEKKNYLGAIADSLTNAKSFKVELDASLSQSDDNSAVEATVKGNVEISQNADNEELYDLAFSIELEGTDKWDENDDGKFQDDEIDEIEQSISLYVQDGYVYMGAGDTWRKYHKPYNEVLAAFPKN